jgi:plasmid stabilization system protein ParE
LSIIWSPEAVADVEAALDYLIEHSPPAPQKLATGIVSLVDRVDRIRVIAPSERRGRGLKPGRRDAAGATSSLRTIRAKHFAHFSRQRGRSERLLEIRHAGVEDPVL